MHVLLGTIFLLNVVLVYECERPVQPEFASLSNCGLVRDRHLVPPLRRHRSGDAVGRALISLTLFVPDWGVFAAGLRTIGSAFPRCMNRSVSGSHERGFSPVTAFASLRNASHTRGGAVAILGCRYMRGSHPLPCPACFNRSFSRDFVLRDCCSRKNFATLVCFRKQYLV